MNRIVKNFGQCWIGVILSLGVAGCGLSDYEKRMDEQRRRILEFDDVNGMLDDPLEPPTILKPGTKDEPMPAWLVDVYLRLPKGFGTTVKYKDKKPYNDPFPCFRYSGNDPDANMFVVAGLVAESKKLEKYDVYLPLNFRSYVKSALEDFYFKTYLEPAKKPKFYFPTEVKLGMKTEKIGVKQFTPFSPPAGTKGDEITYELIVFSDERNPAIKDHMKFQAYFHEEGGKQICIVAHRLLQMGNEALFTKSVDACLGTLDMSAEAGSKRRDFLRLYRR